MKSIYQYIKAFFAAASITVLVSGCSLFGLEVQKDYDRDPHTLDPHINKTVWQFLKDRSRGSTAATQTFTRMMEAIEYAEIDSTEYMKPGRTYILLTNDAVTNSSSNTSFWKNVKVSGANVTSWTSYPKEFVRNYLLYLIVEGEYNHYTIPVLETINTKTLAPEGAFNILPANITMLNFIANNNPESLMYLKVLNSSPSNTSDYPVQINNTYNIRTSSILATNGTAHVAGAYLIPMLPL